jgi:hypothetical protein
MIWYAIIPRSDEHRANLLLGHNERGIINKRFKQEVDLYASLELTY